MKYFEVPKEEKWRISFVNELLMLNNKTIDIEGFTQGEINEILTKVCTS